MKLTLNESFTAEEKNYLNQYLVEITLGKYILIDSNNLQRFLDRLAYPLTHKDEGSISLNAEQKDVLANKLIQLIMNNDSAFAEIIMTDITCFYQLTILPCFLHLLNELILKAANTLRTNEEVKKSFITSIADIHMLTQLGVNPARMFLKVLSETDVVARLLSSYDDLCFEIKRFPKLSYFLLSCISNDNRLTQLIFPSVDQLSKFKEFLLSKNLLNERIGSILQSIEKNLGQNRENTISLSSTYSLFSLPQSLSSNTLAQIKQDPSHIVEEQITEIEHVTFSL